MSELSERILKKIEEEHISYGELSKLTGLSKSMLQRYATGETKKIPVEALKTIATALHTTAGYLMGWEDPSPAEVSPRAITDDELRFALFGDAENITDADLAKVKEFAAFIKSGKG